MDWQPLIWNERVVAALVTAIVGGGVVAMGWFWTHALSRRRDLVLRREQINDMQRALLAEIRAHVVVLERQMKDSPYEHAMQRMLSEGYAPILPHDANDRIFRAVIGDAHMLPEATIDPVVRYYRLLTVRTALGQDVLRLITDDPDRATSMFLDYVAIESETLETGREAVNALAASLQGKAVPVNRTSADRSDQ